MKQGLVLFAHGSRDPDWARPFQRIAKLLEKNPDFEVRLAYLEIMKPSLDEALADLVASNVAQIRVVPVFLGFGSHLRSDLPALVAAANVGVAISIDPPIGEEPRVIEAIATAISRP